MKLRHRCARRLAILGLSIAALFSFGAIGGCDRGPLAHGRMSPDKLKKLAEIHLDDALDDLDATAEQRARIFTLKDRVIDETAGLRDARKQLMSDLLAEWGKDTPDADKARAAVDRSVEELRQVGYQLVDAGVDLHSVLTPEQRTALTERIKERHR